MCQASVQLPVVCSGTLMACAFFVRRASAGSNIAARIAMMAMNHQQLDNVNSAWQPSGTLFCYAGIFIVPLYRQLHGFLTSRNYRLPLPSASFVAFTLVYLFRPCQLADQVGGGLAVHPVDPRPSR